VIDPIREPAEFVSRAGDRLRRVCRR